MMFSFKSKSKIKKEILKELKEEMKKEELKKKKQEEKVSSFKETEPPKIVNNSPEDLKEIQMKFLKLSVLLFVTIIVFILVFIYNDYLFGNNKNEKNNNNDSVVEKNDESTKSLCDISDGNINVDDAKLNPLYSMFNAQIQDYGIVDISFLYKKDLLLSSDLNNKQLLYLMSKTEEFSELIKNSRVLTDVNACISDGIINIKKESIDKILLERFNRNNIDYSSFDMTYYENNQFVGYIKFQNKDGLFSSSCYTKKLNEPRVLVETLVSSVLKKNKDIIINVKVSFSTSSGVYSDIELKNKIFNKVDLYTYDDLKYRENGSLYRVTFRENSNKSYYFYSIERVRENK